mgnify:FL=1
MAESRHNFWNVLAAASRRDRNPGFRDTLRVVMRKGLQWAGIIGLVNIFCFVAINVLVLNQDMILIPAGPGSVAPSDLLLIDDAYVVVISLIYLWLSWRGCSLRTGRLVTAFALISGGAIMLYDDPFFGHNLQNAGFVTMLYMVAVIAIPFRPWHVLVLGSSIVAVMLSLSTLGVTAVLQHIPVIGVATALMTGISVLLYNNRWSEYAARQQTQKALDEHRLLLRTTQEVGNIGGWQMDLVEDTLSCTRQIYRIYERPVNAAFTFDVLNDPIDDGANATFRSAVTRCAQTGEPFELELPLAVGEGKWVEVRGDAIRRNGKIVEIAGTLQDVTDRHAMEAELRAGRATMRSLYGAMENLLRASGRDEVATQIEGLVRRTLKYPVASVRFFEEGKLVTVDESKSGAGPGGDGAYTWTACDIHSETPAAEAYCTGETVRIGDTWIETPGTSSGSVRSAVYVPVASHGVISVGSREPNGMSDLDVRLIEIMAANAAVVLDRTHQVEALVAAREQAEQARAQAEEANRLKSAFLANMSHEIRTPMTSIIGFAEMIGEVHAASRPDDEADVLHFARLIEKSGRRLFDTLNSVIDFSKLEAGAMALEPSTVDASEAVHAAIERFRGDAEESDVSLLTDVPDGSVELEADAKALRRILDNLLSNAVKFTPEGGSVVIRLREEDEWLRIEIQDTGVGIDEAFIPHLFEAFRQESTGRDRAFEGNGLGLAITHRLATLMDGSVDVKSIKNKGTRFTLRLPLEGRATVDEP